MQCIVCRAYTPGNIARPSALVEHSSLSHSLYTSNLFALIIEIANLILFNNLRFLRSELSLSLSWSFVSFAARLYSGAPLAVERFAQQFCLRTVVVAKPVQSGKQISFAVQNGFDF